MDVYCWVIFLYVAGTLIVGWVLLQESELFAPRHKDRFVPASYWGKYYGSESVDCNKAVEQEALADI